MPLPAVYSINGSSPRMQETHSQHPGINDRFIPAYAGNTSSMSCIGSSPRMRETQLTLVEHPIASRSIPACVENTPFFRFNSIRAVHPRVCGEHTNIRCTYFTLLLPNVLPVPRKSWYITICQRPVFLTYARHFTLQRPSNPAAPRAHPGEPAGIYFDLYNTHSISYIKDIPAQSLHKSNILILHLFFKTKF